MTSGASNSPAVASSMQRATRFVPVVLWMGIIFYLSAQRKLPHPPHIAMQLISVAGHFTVYLVLAALSWWALGAFRLEARTRGVIVFLAALAYGVTDEWHQSFVPGRTPDIRDLMVDAVGAAVGIFIAMGIAWYWSTHRS